MDILLGISLIFWIEFQTEMASAGSVPYKQDLPPKGGYAPINYKRIPARSVLNAPLIYGGLFASMAYGAYQYKRGMRQVFKNVGVHWC